ncbi:type IV pilus twitching motility protein PilT [Selenomonas ruminantium]|uniref:type IV pilus twitching motility protein PilT n=1 Tax=Selenomonas ruminantium TaxID=971 RepID=UPI0026EC5996|nr:PilT/PilU family type 4a pilus ATPase [Selenomonas ruminantium]
MVLANLVEMAKSRKSSDIHIIEGQAIYCRNHDGKIDILSDTPVSKTEVQVLFRDLITEDKAMLLKNNGDIDLASSFGDTRTRINIFREQNGLSAVIRLLQGHIPTMNELRLPMTVQNLINKDHGLILFTAATGNGKTTSIASMLQAISERHCKRIIMIEDPIEYLHENNHSLFSQREVGRDVPDFATGLRSALREDPDIIMIGEMRDRETILSAIAAAESGHLVFSTLHSADVIQATDRILQYFPAGEQDTIQAQFANAFEAVVAQKLIPRKDKQGRVAAFEVLLKTDATKNVIRSGNSYNLRGYMTLKDGMNTMDYSISELRRKGIIL